MGAPFAAHLMLGSEYNPFYSPTKPVGVIE
jgi:hypothetical protein